MNNRLARLAVPIGIVGIVLLLVVPVPAPLLDFLIVCNILLALLVLPIFATVILIAGILIKLESRGPMFFVQERMGFRGKVFRIIKLRTMHERKTKGSSFTEENDSRITRIGAVLRKVRIDEFPQILNIFAGQMSWIGPRPEAIDLSEKYEAAIPFYSYRHIVRPGITGWAQIHQGYAASVEESATKLSYDLYYVRNHSLLLDIDILLRTAFVMAARIGSR
mgnify:CR=1 FL=1